MMWKIVGMCLVLVSTLGSLNGWSVHYRQRIECNRQLAAFLMHLSQTLETEQIPFCFYLEEYSFSSEVLETLKKDLLESLYEFRFDTGEEAWKQVIEKRKKQLWMEPEQWMVLVRAGKGIFGNHRMENISNLKMNAQQIEHFCETQMVTYIGKQKIYFPVGLLGSLMGILVLL